MDNESQKSDPLSQKQRRLSALRYASLGLEMGFAVLVGGWIGQWVDARLGIEPFGLLGGLALGCSAAVRGLWRLVSLTRSTNER